MDSNLISAFLTLTAIALGLGIMLMFIKKYAKQAKNKSGAKIKIHERVALFQKSHLAIVEINNRFYLMGATENNISILKELNSPKMPNNITEELANDKNNQKINSELSPEINDLSFSNFIKSAFKVKNIN